MSREPQPVAGRRQFKKPEPWTLGWGPEGDSAFLFRLEKSDLHCCEWVEAICELANVSMSRRGGQGLQDTGDRGPARNLAGRLFLASSSRL